MTLTPRDRVLTAVNHQEPDRVPLALWGSWYGITDKLYFRLLDTLGWEPVAPFRPDRVHSVNYYDDRLLAKLQVDVRHVDPGAIAAAGRPGPGGSDAFGIHWDTSGLYRTARRHPLQQATVDQIMDHPFPAVDESIQADPILARLAKIRALDQEYAIVGRAVASYGFLEMSQSLRKHEQLFTDLILAPEIVDALVTRLYDFYAALIIRFLDIAGDQLDILELPGDDFAGNAGPLISPATFDRFFKEPYQKLISLIKKHSPHIKVVYHSDGAMDAFLSRLIDIGADIFHSVEPLPVWNLAEMKAQHGDRLVFMGGIDIREALQGNKTAVVTEVKTRLSQLAAGGGYILAPSNHLQWDIPPQNLFTLFEAAVEHGRYPLKLDPALGSAPAPGKDKQSLRPSPRRPRPKQKG